MERTLSNLILIDQVQKNASRNNPQGIFIFIESHCQFKAEAPPIISNNSLVMAC